MEAGDTGRRTNWGGDSRSQFGQADLEIPLHLPVTPGLPVHRSPLVTVAIVMEEGYLQRAVGQMMMLSLHTPTLEPLQEVHLRCFSF